MKKLMVFVPHADDEINVAGSTIAAAVQNGAEVHVVYSTDSGYSGQSERRKKEAIRSCAILGVPEARIHCLDYPDTSNEETDHIFLHLEKRERFIRDIERIIEEIMPDVLISVDLDFHADHRALSIGFDLAMGRLLRKMPSYRPEVYKGFAYSTAFYADPDFYEMSETKEPVFAVNSGGEQESLEEDEPFYRWEERISVPVPPDCITPQFGRNTIYKALQCHHSQNAVHFFISIANTDQVFFPRHADNKFFHSRVTVSSGNADRLTDFLLYGTQDILHKAHEPVETNFYAWFPDKEDDQREIRIRSGNEKLSGTLILYVSCRNIQSGPCIRIIEDGNAGREKTVSLSRRFERVKVQIDDAEEISIITNSSEIGIFEMEFVEPDQNDIGPVLKEMTALRSLQDSGNRNLAPVSGKLLHLQNELTFQFDRGRNILTNTWIKLLNKQRQ